VSPLRDLAHRAAAGLTGRIASRLLPGGPAVAVLLYHRVVPRVGRNPWSLEVGEENFREQMRWLRSRYPVLPLERALADLEAGSLPARQVVCISFDDGYRDNLTRALPILEELELPATLFLTTGYVGSGRPFWWDLMDRIGTATVPQGLRPGEDPYGCAKALEPRARERWLGELGCPARSFSREDLPLDAEEIPRLAGRFHLGGHGHDHVSLGLVPGEVADADVEACAQALERIGGSRPPLFAYPFGGPEDVSPHAVDAVRSAGFSAAFTTGFGVVRRGAEPLRLPRVWVHDGDGRSLAGPLLRAFARSR